MDSVNRSHTVAIIPARGGSKGLLRKNLRMLGGQPLISYSILGALNAGNIDRVVVSTEDEEIASVAREWGAEVPFLRPRELSEDNVTIGKAVSHALEQLYGKNTGPVVHVTLYPTSPFRSAGLIRFLTSKLHEGYSSVTTGKEVFPERSGYFRKGENGYENYGAFGDVSPGRWFRPYGVFVGGRQTFEFKQYLHVLKSEVSLIDIDYEEDLLFAEKVLERNLFDKSSLSSWENWDGIM